MDFDETWHAVVNFIPTLYLRVLGPLYGICRLLKVFQAYAFYYTLCSEKNTHSHFLSYLYE